MREVKERETRSITPYEFNNRRHDESQIEKIARSIKEFGFNQPIVVDESGVILVGHGRLFAARKLGISTVPVVELTGLNDEQKRAYRILDNKLQNDSTWDFNNLDLELGWLEDQGFDLQDWGLDALREMLQGEQGEPETSEDEGPPEAREETIIKRGDLIELGRHAIMCGDSRDITAWRESDICFTSPPYNRGSNVAIANRSMTESSYKSCADDLGDDEYREFLGSVSSNALQSCDIAAINIQMLAGNKFDLCGWLYDVRRHLVDVAVWNKRLAAPAASARVMNSAFEFLFILSRDDRPSRAISTATFHGDRSNVINIDPTRSLEFAAIHAATMPISFAAEALKIVGGNSVIDPFMGTGTTLIAADQLDRTCYGIEIEPKYCDVIVRRYIADRQRRGKDVTIKINGEIVDKAYFDV